MRISDWSSDVCSADLQQPGGEHVVRPHDEAHHADRDHRVRHAEIAEHRLAAEGRDDLADHAEARQDHDVDLGVAEEPEQMLVEHRIAAARRTEEGRAEIRAEENTTELQSTMRNSYAV